MLKVSFTILSVVCLLVQCDGARILAMFPCPSISHQVVFRPLMQELARRGHEVTVITPDPAFPKGKTPNNLTEIDVHDMSYALWYERFVKHVDPKNAFKVIQFGLSTFSDIVELQLNIKEVKEILNSGKTYDLIFVEAMVRSALILTHIFKAPVIQMSSMGALPPNYQVFGVPNHPVYYPEVSRQRLYNLTLWEKIGGMYEDFQLRYLMWTLEDADNAMIKKNFGPNVPTVTELANNVDMLFLNVDSMFVSNQAVPSNVIFLGGLHQKPQKELPKDLQSYLDSSKNGVIYMSFGTNVNPSQLPAERIKIFTKVFSKLPYQVLWKWDKDVLPDKPENVRLSKWVPQSDLLRHPNIKLFITQGGLQSTDEAITAGVPLLTFPILGDQWYNAERHAHFRIGKKLNIETVTEQVLENAIKEVISDKSYRENIQRMGVLMRDRPQTSLERAVWWTEYVIRHKGAKHLRSAAFNVSWAEFLMLDVLIVLLTILITIVTISGYVLNLLIQTISGNSKKIKQH